LVNRSAVVEFILDTSKWTPGARKVNTSLRQMKGATDSASAGQDRLKASIQRSGDQAAASAVRFQTMTQGMLNLTTAGVQTFTSMSNIDRAGNRLAQSNIAVARATDLLNNKELRLQQIRESGGDPRKIVLITREIGTARADLTVKTDKLKIEEGALRDVQLLFATNIANVTISSMQTITTLKQAQVFMTIKQIFTQKILNRVVQQTTATNILSTPGYKAHTFGATASTFAIKGLTFSVKGLLVVLGPIGLIIGGIAAAMHIWENDIGGVKTALQDMLPFLKDQTALSKGVDDITGDLSETYAELTAGIGGLVDTKGPVDLWALATARNLRLVRSEALKTQARIAGLAEETKALEAATANFRSPLIGLKQESLRRLQLQDLNKEDKEKDKKIDIDRINFAPGILNFLRGIRTLAPVFIDKDKLAFLRDEKQTEFLINQKGGKARTIDPAISGQTATFTRLPKLEPTFIESFEKAFTTSKLPFDTVRKIIGTTRGSITQDALGKIREVKQGLPIFGQPFQRQQVGVIPFEKRLPQITIAGRETPQTEAILKLRLKDLSDQKAEFQGFFAQGLITNIENEQAQIIFDNAIDDTAFSISNLSKFETPQGIKFGVGAGKKAKPPLKFTQFDERIKAAFRFEEQFGGLRAITGAKLELVGGIPKAVSIIFEQRRQFEAQKVLAKIKVNPSTGLISLADIQNRNVREAITVIFGQDVGPKTRNNLAEILRAVELQSRLAEFNRFPQRGDQVGFDRSAATRPIFPFDSPFNITQTSLDFAGKAQHLPSFRGSLIEQKQFVQSLGIKGTGGQATAAISLFKSLSRGFAGGGTNFANLNFVSGGAIGEGANRQILPSVGVSTPIHLQVAAQARDARANLMREAFGFVGMGRRFLRPQPSIGQRIAAGFTIEEGSLPPDLILDALRQLAGAKAEWDAFSAAGFGNAGRWRETLIRRIRHLGSGAPADIKADLMAIFQKRIDSAFTRYSPFLDITENDVRVQVLAGKGNVDVFGDRIRWNERLEAITTGEI